MLDGCAHAHLAQKTTHGAEGRPRSGATQTAPISALYIRMQVPDARAHSLTVMWLATCSTHHGWLLLEGGCYKPAN